MDLDVSNYTIQELSSLIGIEKLGVEEIKQAIVQQKKEHPSKKSIDFFNSIQERLLKEVKEEPVQKTISVEIKKGNINPDLKTTITRLINIDSAYRSRVSTANTSDQFVFELSEPLLNVVSLSFYSLELPQSWYTISQAKGTNSFLVYLLDDSYEDTGSVKDMTLQIIIPEGNYTTEHLCRSVIDAVNKEITDYNKLYEPGFAVTLEPFSECYNHNTGKFTFLFSSPTKETYTIQLIWVDDDNLYPEMNSNRENYNLGWLLGTRSSLNTCAYSNKLGPKHYYKYVPESLVDVSGTKYVTLALDDYKTNRLNRSILSITNTPNKQMTLPKYFTKDVPKYKVSPTKTNALPSNPRNLTSKQIYTINAIMDKQVSHNLITSYDSADSFAKIPVKRTDWGKTDSTGKTVILDVPNKLFVENGGPIQLQSREYFGPVDISTLSTALYDDKGNLLGLNGMDWSFSLLAKCIYQY